MHPDELNAAERRLWDACPRGVVVDVRDAGPADAEVRAEVLAALLLGAGGEPGSARRPALRLTGARVTGELDLRFARLDVPLVLTGCRLDETIQLSGATCRELVLTDCTLPGLVADLAQVDGRCVLSGCRTTGPLVLTRSQIRGELDLRRSVVGSAPGDEAISAVHAAVGGDLLCSGLEVTGRFRLSGATVGGEFDLEGAALSNPGGTALDAYHVEIGEDLTFHPGFRAEGRIILSGATVKAAIGFCGAWLSNPGGTALEAVDVHVARNFDLGEGLRVEGGVVLDGTRVGTRLSFRDATLTAPGGTALSLHLAQARETDLRTRRPVEGTVDARGARLGTLDDTPETWPADQLLAEAAYDAFATPLPAAERLEWLRRGTRDYLPQPYEQLAASYRRLGHEDEARTVLLAKQRRRRAALPPLARAWGHLQDVTVGYGYRPLRAAAWLLALGVSGVLFFTAHPPVPLDRATAPPFNALVYTAELLLPVAVFGQKAAYGAHGAGQWLAYGLTAAGAVLAVTVAAGVTRALVRP